MSRLEDIMSRVGEIQPLPSEVLRLINAMNDPNSTVGDMVEIIRYEQGLTARMLRMCNSASFGLPHEVECLEDAMRYLGTLKVLQLVMAGPARGLLSRGQAGYGLEPGVLWQHSVAVALTSTLFAERTQPPTLGLAFTAGLLHDIGKVVLNEYVAEEFARIVRLVAEQRISFDEAERQVFGCASTEIGARMSERWQLPGSIVRCIRYHRTPGELDPPDVLVDTIHLADCVCMLCGIGLGADGLCYRADPRVMERYQLKEPDLEAVGAQMLVDLKRVQRLFTEHEECQITC